MRTAFLAQSAKSPRTGALESGLVMEALFVGGAETIARAIVTITASTTRKMILLATTAWVSKRCAREEDERVDAQPWAGSAGSA